jgi:hypothetical protein
LSDKFFDKGEQEMSDLSMETNESSVSKIGWGILLFVTISNVVGHIGLLLFDNLDTIFVAWATMNVLAAMILFTPYRRGERWAWYAIWVLIIPFATIIFFNAQIGPIYLGEAALLVVGQLLNYRAFSQAE